MPTEPLHPESAETLRQLVKLHGAKRILDTVRDIAMAEAIAGLPGNAKAVPIRQGPPPSLVEERAMLAWQLKQSLR